MKEYRKRFVQLNMLLIGLVLFLMMAVIAVYMYRDYYDGLQATMEQLVEPMDSFSQMLDDKAPSSRDNPPLNQPGSPDESPKKPENPDNQKGIMTVFYTPSEDTISVISQTTLFENDTLKDLLEEVISQDSHFGTLSSYHTIYYCSGNGTPYKIALAPTSYIGHSMLRLIVVLLAIWAGTMLCFFFVSVQLSKVAVRPMEEAMQREKQFVADASHDLKTPLSVILANNSILMENPDATVGSLKRWTDSTQSAAKKMQKLIGEMLTLADVERPDAPLPKENVDVASVVTKATLELESVAYEKNVTLETTIPEQLFLFSNPDYLQRIAASLIENAIKYEPDGGTVSVTLRTRKRSVCLEVRNQSTTISPEDLSHVFERFYRGDKSRQGKAGGHGLGLAITKQMVERLGGEITVQSSVEEGTVFTFSVVNTQPHSSP